MPCAGSVSANAGFAVKIEASIEVGRISAGADLEFVAPRRIDRESILVEAR